VIVPNYKVDLAVPGNPPKADREELDYFLRPSRLVPTPKSRHLA
jgi:hypothetical protein